jgi:hypothetical protein
LIIQNKLSKYREHTDNGKPGESRGRKATGLRSRD